VSTVSYPMLFKRLCITWGRKQ